MAASDCRRGPSSDSRTSSEKGYRKISDVSPLDFQPSVIVPGEGDSNLVVGGGGSRFCAAAKRLIPPAWLIGVSTATVVAVVWICCIYSIQLAELRTRVGHLELECRQSDQRYFDYVDGIFEQKMKSYVMPMERHRRDLAGKSNCICPPDRCEVCKLSKSVVCNRTRHRVTERIKP